MNISFEFYSTIQLLSGSLIIITKKQKQSFFPHSNIIIYKLTKKKREYFSDDEKQKKINQSILARVKFEYSLSWTLIFCSQQILFKRIIGNMCGVFFPH